MTAIFTEHRFEPPVSKMPPASGGCRERMVGLASTTGKLISSTLLGSHTVLQKIGHVWIVYQNMAAVGHVRNESFGDKPPQAGIAQIQPFTFGTANGCGQTDKIAVVVFHRCFLLKIFVV